MTNTSYYDLIFVIVNIGKASRVLAEAKKIGITGGTISIAHGTVNSGLLRKLGLSEIRKEVLLMVSRREHTVLTINHIKETFHLEEPNRGIIFSTPLSTVVGTHAQSSDLHETDPAPSATHEMFVSIVPEGDGDKVIEAVREAGGAGGTVIPAYGAFAETVTQVFGIEINSEKEIVINLVGKHLANTIESELTKKINFNDKDTGILFSVDAQNVRGVYEG
ncbi:MULTISPECIES: P-II family nitrogen regulator [unclassified Jeotgalibaca]|uniref:P-II family nitrogen regulator n=1 Tax=unclassified Jeotgalibaca TaxID=2621505 RepID=UPI003FD559CC